MERETAIIGIGTNLGAKVANVHAAVAFLESRPGIALTARSRLYDTEPVGPLQPRFVNAAVRIEHSLEPHALLEACLAIETRLGRDRSTEVRWGPRSMDLDVLHSFGRTVDDARLVLPHPRLAERSFAIAPLLDVAPELAATYAPILETLGGAPPSRRFAQAPVARHDSFVHTAHAADDADGWALSLSAVVAAITPSAALEVSEPFEVASLPELPERVAGALARGLGVRLVSIAGIEPGSIRGAFHGASRPRRNVRVTAARVEGGYVWAEAREDFPGAVPTGAR